MESVVTPYPVVFFDGGQEQEKGFVGVHALLTFKVFQNLLGQKMGIPANQLSVAFICRRTNKASEKRQRLPINGNTNFGVLINQHNPNKERDCYFLVSLRKSRKEPRRSRKRGVDNPDWISSGNFEGIGEQDTLSQSSSGSNNSSIEPSSPSISSYVTPKKMDMNHVKILGYGYDEALLKRSNTSAYPKQFRDHVGAPAFQPAATKAVDGLVQSPFTTFHLTDQNINSIEDPSQRRTKARESWGLQSLYAPPYNPESTYNYGSSDLLYQDDRQWHKFIMSRGSEYVGHRAYRPSNLQESYLKMCADGGFLRANAYFSTSSPNSHFEGSPQANVLLGGSWQKMPDMIRSIPDFRGISSNVTSYSSGCKEEACRCHFCYDCKRRNISPIPFHGCVEDTITKGFQGPSPAGPIGRRPKTNHMEASRGGLILAA